MLGASVLGYKCVSCARVCQVQECVRCKCVLDTSVCWIHVCVGDKCVPGLKFWGTSVSDSYQTFQLMSAVVRLKGLVKVPLFW